MIYCYPRLYFRPKFVYADESTGYFIEAHGSFYVMRKATDDEHRINNLYPCDGWYAAVGHAGSMLEAMAIIGAIKAEGERV